MTIATNEIFQRVVGLLTLCQGTTWHELMTDDEESAFQRGFASLRLEQDVLSGTVNVVIPHECADAAQTAVQEVTKLMVQQTAKLAAGFVLAFQALADEYEAKCPEADVGGILQRVSLAFEEPFEE